MTNETLRAGLVDHRNPIERGTRPILHRGYHLELEDDYGGGISQGEFLLRSDGALFKRSVLRSMEPWRDGPSSLGRRDEGWTGGPDGNALWAWLRARGYDVHAEVYPIDAGDDPGRHRRSGPTGSDHPHTLGAARDDRARDPGGDGRRVGFSPIAKRHEPIDTGHGQPWPPALEDRVASSE